MVGQDGIVSNKVLPKNNDVTCNIKAQIIKIDTEDTEDHREYRDKNKLRELSGPSWSLCPKLFLVF